MPQAETGATQWGRWSYDAQVLALNHDDGYQIDVERLTSSAAMLDAIMQVHNKVWTTTEDVGNLVAAFNSLLQPQAYLCSTGQDKRIDDVASVLARRGY